MNKILNKGNIWGTKKIEEVRTTGHERILDRLPF